MVTPTSLLTSSSSSLLIILLLLQSFFQTSQANNNNPHCNPSACGILPDIRSPFRLKGQPKNCGYTNFELSCENDVASIYSDSRKYYVKAINYEYSSMRAVDAAISNVDACSFPNSSTYSSTYDLSPCLTPTYYDDPFYYKHSSSTPINFIRCPLPLNNSDYNFTDITRDCASNFNSSHLRYGYVKVGHMNASEVPRTCGVGVMVMTSWEFEDLNNVSLSEIHRSLMYGLELYFCSDGNSQNYWGKLECKDFDFSLFCHIYMYLDFHSWKLQRHTCDHSS